MRLLITGHHGYIGSVLLPLAAAEGHEIVAMDSDLFERCIFGGEPAAGPWTSVRRDLRDVTRGELEGFDGIIHLAALSNDPLGDLHPELTFEVNLEGSRRLARLAKEAGVERFVFASSCSNYGASGGDDLLDEEAALSPITPYAVSKVEMEKELQALADESFSPVALRNATAYGASPRLRLDIVLNNLVGWGLTTGRIVLMSDGTPWRPIVHVEDIARAMLAVVVAPRERVHARAFNIVPEGENYRIRDLAGIVGETLPECEVGFASDAAPDARNYRVSGRRFVETFPEFRFRWDAKRGARQLADAYRAAGMDREQFDGPRFKRLGWLKGLIASGALGEDLRWRAGAEAPSQE